MPNRRDLVSAIVAILGRSFVSRASALSGGMLTACVSPMATQHARDASEKTGEPILCGMTSNEALTGGILRMVVTGENLRSSHAIFFQNSGVSAKILVTNQRSVELEISVAPDATVGAVHFTIMTNKGPVHSACYELVVNIRAAGSVDSGATATGSPGMDMPSGSPGMDMPSGSPGMDMPSGSPGMDVPSGSPGMNSSLKRPSAKDFTGVGGHLI